MKYEKSSVFTIHDKIKDYKQHWKKSFVKVEEDQLLKIITDYNPQEKRDVGHFRIK